MSAVIRLWIMDLGEEDWGSLSTEERHTMTLFPWLISDSEFRAQGLPPGWSLDAKTWIAIRKNTEGGELGMGRACVCLRKTA